MKLDSNKIWDKIWCSARCSILELTSSSVTTSLWDGVWALIRRKTRIEAYNLIERSIDISIDKLNEN